MNAALKMAIDQLLDRVRTSAIAGPGTNRDFDPIVLELRLDGVAFAVRTGNQKLLEAHIVDLSAYLVRLAAARVQLALQVVP